jgi:hypothetical protein
MIILINKLNIKILKYASLSKCFNHSNFNFDFNLKLFKMLKLNEKYVINNGQGSIVFTEGNKGTVNAVYTIRGNKSEGKINGTLDGNLLKGTFHVDAAAGLIEFTFDETGFDAKWKQGIEPGPMKGKWQGKIENDKKEEISNSDTFILKVDGYELEVSAKNLERNLIWTDTIAYCKELGHGWRVPTFNELNAIFINLADNKIGDFERDPYWSSDEIDSEFLKGIIMSLGVETRNWKYNETFVRPVKNKS